MHDCRNSSDTKRQFSLQPFPMPKRLYIYIHGCRASSIKVLSTRQPFLIPKGFYTRLPFIKFKNVIHTAAVFHARVLYTLLQCFQYEMDTCNYTAVVPNKKLGMSPESGCPNVRITFRSPNPISASGGSNKILKMFKNAQYYSENIFELSHNEVT